MSDLENEIRELLSGHRLSQGQLQALQQGESDSDTVRSLQRMLANTQNALLRVAREIDGLRAPSTPASQSQPTEEQPAGDPLLDEIAKSPDQNS